MAVWLLDVLATADLPLPIPVALDPRPDGRVLEFTLGVSIVAGALLGLVPALQSTRPDLAGALRSEIRAAASPVSSGGATRWSSRSSRSRSCRSSGPASSSAASSTVQSAHPAFNRDPTAIPTFLTPATRFTPDEARVSTRRLLGRFRELPVVEAVGAISNLHLHPLNTGSSHFNVDSVEPPADNGAFIADRADVDPASSTRQASRCSTGAASATPSAGWCGGATPIPSARRRRGERREGTDARRGAPQHRLCPVLERFTRSLAVVARTSTDPERTALALLTAGRGVDPDLCVLETTMDRHLALMSLPQQLSAFVLSAFGVLALALVGSLRGSTASRNPGRHTERRSPAGRGSQPGAGGIVTADDLPFPEPPGAPEPRFETGRRERDRANDRAARSRRCGVQRGTRARGCDASYSSTVT